MEYNLKREKERKKDRESNFSDKWPKSKAQ